MCISASSEAPSGRRRVHYLRLTQSGGRVTAGARLSPVPGLPSLRPGAGGETPAGHFV